MRSFFGQKYIACGDILWFLQFLVDSVPKNDLNSMYDGSLEAYGHVFWLSDKNIVPTFFIFPWGKKWSKMAIFDQKIFFRNMVIESS